MIITAIFIRFPSPSELRLTAGYDGFGSGIALRLGLGWFGSCLVLWFWYTRKVVERLKCLIAMALQLVRKENSRGRIVTRAETAMVVLVWPCEQVRGIAEMREKYFKARKYQNEKIWDGWISDRGKPLWLNINLSSLLETLSVVSRIGRIPYPTPPERLQPIVENQVSCNFTPIHTRWGDKYPGKIHSKYLESLDHKNRLQSFCYNTSSRR